MSFKIERKKFVGNLISVLEKELTNELPEKGDNWEMVEAAYAILTNKLFHIRRALNLVGK